MKTGNGGVNSWLRVLPPGNDWDASYCNFSERLFRALNLEMAALRADWAVSDVVVFSAVASDTSTCVWIIAVHFLVMPSRVKRFKFVQVGNWLLREEGNEGGSTAVGAVSKRG